MLLMYIQVDSIKNCASNVMACILSTVPGAMHCYLDVLGEDVVEWWNKHLFKLIHHSRVFCTALLDERRY